MGEESYIMVNLKEKKAKKLAQVISNETSRAILDLLAKKDMSASEMAKELGVGLSRVHYNLKHLMEVNLIKVEEFHYSKKGREVDHYSLAHKVVIIAPDAPKMASIKERLKGLLPVALISAAAGGLLHMFGPKTQALSQTLSTATRVLEEPEAIAVSADAGGMAYQAAKSVVAEADTADATLADEASNTFFEWSEESAPEVAEAMPRAAEAGANAALDGLSHVTESTTLIPMDGPSAAVWFLVGAGFALLLVLLFALLRRRRK